LPVLFLNIILEGLGVVKKGRLGKMSEKKGKDEKKVC